MLKANPHEEYCFLDTINSGETQRHKKKRLKQPRKSESVRIETCDSMKGSHGPNAALQKMFKERHSIPMDDIPSYLKHYMISNDYASLEDR